MEIRFIYTDRPSWNCSRFCESIEEYNMWVEHEQKYGNKLKFTDFGCICYIAG